MGHQVHPQSRAVSGRKTLAITLLPASESGALGARRVPRERVRGRSALRLVERSGTEITVVKRRPRQRALRNVPRQRCPYDVPHLGGFRLRGSCAYSITHFLRRQTTVFFQTSPRGGEYIPGGAGSGPVLVVAHGDCLAMTIQPCQE